MPPKREYSEKEREDLRTMRVLEELIATNGWKVYSELVNRLKFEQHTKVLQPVGSIGELFFAEYAKGAVYGLTQATDLPGIIIQGVRESVLPAKDQEEE